ncbi:5'/3'-nucleotidase SurE [Nitratidesulfovibrio sp. D1]|uniref:5'/3'-nucleotidase SurE n=1 Tax=Nitratidesulfovibrio sp. D1 TaxID=3440151 RepID=UPI003EBD51A7
MIIALTNDDGIQAPGLRAMYKALLDAGHEVHVVAPVTEQSAVGHAVTISLPLRVKEFRENGFRGRGVYGTPTDCVKLGLSCLLDKKPDIVVSGINAGANVGPDILYSGTVSAATEAAHMGFPALAVSYDSFRPADLSGQAAHAAGLLAALDWKALPARCVVNLNYPALSMDQVKGVRACPQTRAVWKDWYDHRVDPRGGSYWWLNGTIPPETVAPGTDRALLTEGWVTLTPLRFDFTDHAAMDVLAAVQDGGPTGDGAGDGTGNGAGGEA